MKRDLSVGLLMLMLVALGCGKSGDSNQAADGAANGNSSVVENEVEVPAPDEPIWVPGTPFNDTTRVQVMFVRTFGLDRIYNRALEHYGEDLTGLVSVRMIIEPDGSVSQVQLLDDHWSNPYAAALTDSMLFNIQMWTFPPGLEEPLAVVQPFKFEQ